MKSFRRKEYTPAEVMTFKNKISRQEIEALPQGFFQGNIHLIDRHSSLKEAVEFLSRQKILGFDTESRPSFRKGQHYAVSLLQLATDHDAFLFRLNRLGLPPSLKKILARSSILKVGVAIHDDLGKLNGLQAFEPGAFHDLQHMAGQYGIEDGGLRKLAAIILGIRVSKAQQLSNWEGDELTPAQLRYAATDAWVCLAMYRRLTGQSEEE